jgi:hypothetical protein
VEEEDRDAVVHGEGLGDWDTGLSVAVGHREGVWVRLTDRVTETVSVIVGHLLTEGLLLTEGHLLTELVCEVETLTVLVLVTVTVAVGDHVCALTPGTDAMPRNKLGKPG